jgi:Sel1 repeat
VMAGFKSLYGKEVGRAELGRAANAAGVTGSAHRRDLIIGHLAPGEIVVPPWALSPAVMAALRHELGNQLPRFIVGAGFERRNPVSGLPAFSPANEDDSRETADQLFDFFRSTWETSKGQEPEVRREGALILKDLSKRIRSRGLWSAAFRTRRRLGRDRVGAARRAAGGNAPRSSWPIRPTCVAILHSWSDARVLRSNRFLALAGILISLTGVGAAVQGASLDDGLRALHRGDYASARAELEPLAEAGHPEALTWLAWLYEDGRGVPHDPEKALTLWRQAAARGSTLAMRSLAYRYARGQGVQEDWATAFTWWLRAAESGDPEAQYAVGVALFHGKGTARDANAAVAWLRRAADAGLASSSPPF